MTDVPSADPFAAQQTPPPAAPSPAPTDAGAPAAADTSSEAQSDMDWLRQTVADQAAAIAQLQTDLAARPAPATPIPLTAATTASPTPAAHATGVPGHVMTASLPAEPDNAVVRYAVPAANGGDPLTGYGLVIHVDTIDDGDGNSHAEYVVARLDVLGVRLTAANIVDEEASAQVQQRIDAAQAQGR